MIKQTARLNPSEVLQLEWENNYNDFRIYLHGQLVGSFPDKASLKLGNTFFLPDGDRKITVLLTEGGLEIWYNGVEIRSGVKSGESDTFLSACNYLIGFGVLQVVVGLVRSMKLTGGSATVLAVNLSSVALAGGILIGMGWWAKRSGTTLPLKIAAGFLAVSILVSVLMGGFTGIILTGIMIYYLIRGIQAGPLQKAEGTEFREGGPLDQGF